ncbi:MAG: hypothetical protein GY759_12670 [Chloroflexi bacterium]|nr:hypothetical protein [Chloroflexota bacterium]
MARNDKKRQKKVQRKAAKRKQRHQQLARLRRGFTTPSLRKTQNWPFHEILITENWRDTSQLVQILFSRRGPNDQVAMGMFLVDLSCLGVKNAIGDITDIYRFAETEQIIRDQQKLIPADRDLVAKIVREAVAYAQRLGIRPHRDCRKALMVFGEADADACHETIPLGGGDGKPHFQPGPYDNVDQIMRKLTKAVGVNGFHYTIPIGPYEEFDFD